MELFQNGGSTLRQRVHQEGPLPSGGVYRLAVETLTHLAALHRSGAAHGSVAPAAVVLSRDGAYLADGDQPPAFKAPEQLEGHAGESASDLFAWAATMAFAASGRPPFGEGAAEEVLDSMRRGEPDLDDLPPSLHTIVTACLALDADVRPTAADLARQLTGDDASTGSLGGVQTTGISAVAVDLPPSITGVMRRQDKAAAGAELRSKRVRIALLTVAAVLAALLVAGGGTAYVLKASPSAAKKADALGDVGSDASTAPSDSHKPRASEPGDPSGKPGEDPPRSTTPVRPSTKFHRVDGPNGTSVKVPVGSSLERQSPVSYIWREASTGATLQVDATAWEVTDPVEHWKRFERKAPLPGFRRISLNGPFDFRGWDAADLEFTWRRNDGRVHAVDRGFLPHEGVYIALYFAAPKDRFETLRQAYLDKFFSSFEVGQASCCDGEEPFDGPGARANTEPTAHQPASASLPSRRLLS